MKLISDFLKNGTKMNTREDIEYEILKLMKSFCNTTANYISQNDLYLFREV